MDDGPIPPELIRAFDYKNWGINLMDLPPGELRAASQALNAYNSLHAWYHAKERGKWQDANPAEWEFVSRIIAERTERRRNKR